MVTLGARVHGIIVVALNDISECRAGASTDLPRIPLEGSARILGQLRCISGSQFPWACPDPGWVDVNDCTVGPMDIAQGDIRGKDDCCQALFAVCVGLLHKLCCENW